MTLDRVSRAWMMSLAIVYAGAALAPKMLTSGVAGQMPRALIS